MANEFKARNGVITPFLKSTVTTGIKPLEVDSTTLVDNLNADLLDGKHSTFFYSPDNPAPGQEITVAENTGLELDTSEILSTVYNTTISDDIESVAVGGATPQPASEWKNKNIVEVLDTILFPDVLPSYVVPTAVISGSQTGTKEIGSSISQVLALTTVENDAGSYSQVALLRGVTTLNSQSSPTGTTTTNLPTQFGYTNPNNPNLSYSLAYTDTFTVVAGTTSWTGTGTYLAGLPIQNNKGVTDTRPAAVRTISAPQAASTITSNTASIIGIYPYFWGKSSSQPTASSVASEIAAGTANKVLTAASGTISITYNASAEYIWVAHLATYTEKTKWYNTDLNRGDIGAGNFILAPITQSVNSPDSFWSGVSFDIYISAYASSTTGAIEFRNS
jgi:hypothetical protein